MPSNFIAELQWRGMIHDIMPGTEEALLKKVSAGYIGFDPTADSLHVGHLVQIMTLVHFQRAGHKPYALVGGATGMVGDPSGKSQERNLLDADTLNHNVACVRQQLEAFLDFNSGETAAEGAPPRAAEAPAVIRARTTRRAHPSCNHSAIGVNPWP